MSKTIFQGAYLTVFTLFGGLILGFIVGSLIFEILPGSSIESPAPMHITFAALPALAGFLGEGRYGALRWGALLEPPILADSPGQACSALPRSHWLSRSA
ncbi:MAG: hypothetical protein HC806_00385 [Anaerolineae bacterium]|nr:hypothetical protein [Anaerolineae bacterium]